MYALLEKQVISIIHFLKRVRNRLLRAVSEFRFIRTRSELAYEKRLKAYRSHLPPLSPFDCAILDRMGREGIWVTSLDQLKLPFNSKLFHNAQKLLFQTAAIPSNPKRDYFVKASTDGLIQSPEIFWWGLEDRLLNLIENHLGLPVAYHGLYLRRDLANGVQRRTRLWHLDKEDRRMFKIIIYLNDVREDGGPFQYIPKKFAASIFRSLKYNYGTIPDKVMERVVPRSEWKSCFGPAGTVIFIDPANLFHRGQVPVSSDRLSIFFDYTSRNPKHPYYCKSCCSIEKLTLLSQGLSSRQKSCIFWNDKLQKKNNDENFIFRSKWQTRRG